MSNPDERCDAGIRRAQLAWRVHGSDPDTRTDVFVTTHGSIEVLVAAGLNLGYFDGTVATGSVRVADIDELAAVDGVEWVAMSARTQLLIDKSMKEIGATELRSPAPPYTDDGAPGWTGDGVLVGVIDDMISEFHLTFIKPNTTPQLTRIVAIWDQKLDATGPQNPPGFNYGNFFDEASINDALKRHDLGKINLTATFDHGSHVTGIAAGNGALKDGPAAPFTFVGVAPEADIAVTNAAIAPSSRRASDAVNFLFNLAAERGQPCVINMSFGTHEGARDGSSELERAIDRALHDANGHPIPGRAVVVAAGNEADEARHGRKKVSANGMITFTLNFAPIVFPNGVKLEKDVTNDYLHIWYDGSASLNIRITPPRGAPTNWLTPGNGTAVGPGNTVIATMFSTRTPNPRNNKLQIEVQFEAPAQQGQWHIDLQETAGAPATVDLWVERNDFDIHPKLAGSDDVVNNSVTCPATSASVIAVGNYNAQPDVDHGEKYGDIVRSSSHGLDIADGVTDEQVRPHLVAPGRRIISANRSDKVDHSEKYLKLRFGVGLGQHTVFTGTSQAAPHVTGVIALMFQKNPTLTHVDVRQILTGSVRRDLIPAGTVFPSATWGFGILDAAAALGITPAGGP